jgi:hypothetical protein
MPDNRGKSKNMALQQEHKNFSGTQNEYRKDRWLRSVFLGIMGSSIIIFFWVPLFFELAPGEDYRMMLGGPCSLIIAISGLLYGILLACKSTKHTYLQRWAIILTLLPAALLLSTIVLLAILGHTPAP